MDERRIEVDLDERRYRKLERAAQRAGATIAATVLHAIDLMPDVEDARRLAVENVLAMEPMAVPAEPAELRRELDAAHERLPA